MSGIKADWHMTPAPVDDSDPFAVELDTAPPRPLEAQIRDLIEEEGQLAARGVTCKIKDRSDTCCSACPLRGTLRVDGRRELCRVGCAQERLLMALVTEDERLVAA